MRVVKRETENGKTVYYVNTDNSRYESKSYQPVPDFKNIKISYGIEIFDLARKGNVVYNSKKNYERFLMIEGPWKSQQKLYKNITKTGVKTMKKHYKK